MQLPHLHADEPADAEAAAIARAARRARAMRHVRRFFIVSGVLHLAFFLALAISEDFRKLVFGDPDAERVEFDARRSDIQRAMETLLRIQRERLGRTSQAMVEIHQRMDEIQAHKTARLRMLDMERQARIEAGIYPTPERPDRNAVFSPLVDMEPEPFEPAEPPDVEALDVVELFRWHQPMEERIGRIYERFRALQLAEHPEEPIPLSRAVLSTRLAMPTRRDIDPDKLDMDIDTALDGRLAAFRRELNETYLEAENMVANTRRWLELVAALEAQMDTGFGEQYDMIPPPVPYYGHYLDPRRLRQVSLQRIINPPVALGNQIAAEQGLREGEWMSIDRWYYVGPFGHPGAERRLDQLDRVYPPEVSVDLDATYEGKDGRRIGWKYRRVDETWLERGLRIEPFVADNEAYAIWYFWTQIRSDREQTVLASFASDDFGVAWVNGRRVWQGPPEQQPWVPFTAHSFAPIRLRRGINEILFKLENAPGSTGFSVILMTHENERLIRAAERMGP